jgi:hypothetical protein
MSNTIAPKWSSPVDPADLRTRVTLFAQLDAAGEVSPLPEEPVNEAEIREWLLAVRRDRFGSSTGAPADAQAHFPSRSHQRECHRLVVRYGLA